jgi:two-component system sensor histidine kinase PhoQ
LLLKRSLHLRLVLAAVLSLIAFLGLAGIALERAFRESSEQAIHERLQLYAYTLVGFADVKQNGTIHLSENLPEARFSMLGSGLQGFVLDQYGNQLWRSPSAVGMSIEVPAPLPMPGESVFRNHMQRLELFYPIAWEMEAGSKKLIFVISEHMNALSQPVHQFRKTLWNWLGGIGLLLVITEIWIFGWSLKPLRRMTKDVETIEASGVDRLPDDYPQELQGLANNLNALLNSERSHKERYRNTLADLAHSLKTPLAIIRGGYCDQEPGIDEQTQMICNQVSRMDAIIEYQLKHAAATTRPLFSPEIVVSGLIKKVSDALKKVYASKGVQIKIECPVNGKISCEEGDLYEIVGNLMDNAYKWCQSTVEVKVRFPREPHKKQSGFYLIIEDDGPGIPEDKLQQVLKRGIRADQTTAGHGIGLSIVKELVQLSNGRLEFEKSQLGGLKVDVFLPAQL